MDGQKDPFSDFMSNVGTKSDVLGFSQSSQSLPWWRRKLDEESFTASFSRTPEKITFSSSYGSFSPRYSGLRHGIPKSEQIKLSWENIGVVAPSKRSLTFSVVAPAKTILYEVSGVVQPGTLLAIMGASGSGKTTLLNVLTGRNLGDLEVTGDIKVNGGFVGNRLKRLSGYVQQTDLFMGMLTVSEYLYFQAMLRMQEDFDDEERCLRVGEVIKELGLAKCQNTAIGVPGRMKSISGGERKRLAFAAEVLNNPALLFCDEPTSGLDSFMAENVVQNLKSLARQGRTVLCTIHQPSSQVFALFDNLLLLADGKVAFMGPSRQAPAFFELAGFTCPEQYNPADFYIQTLANTPGLEIVSRSRVDKICQTYDQSMYKQYIDRLIADTSVVYDQQMISLAMFDASNVSEYKSSCLRQFRFVLWRSWLTHCRNRTLTFVRIFIVIFQSIALGCLTLGQSGNQTAIQNVNTALYYIILNATNTNAFTAISEFPGEAAIFKREHENGTYRPSVYYLCKTLVDVPIFLVLPVIFATILYWIVGFKADAVAYFTCIACAILVTNVALSVIYLLSIAAGSVSGALKLTRPIWLPLALLGGYFINDASIPVYFIWFQYLSWYKYANEILIVNQWHNYGNITCSYDSQSFNMTGDECLNNGEEIIASLNYSPDNLTRDFLILLALFLAFRLLGFIALLLRTHSSRLTIHFRKKR